MPAPVLLPRFLNQQLAQFIFKVFRLHDGVAELIDHHGKNIDLTAFGFNKAG